MVKRKDKNPTYYFIEVALKSRQIIGWGTETKDKVEVHLTSGYHRVFRVARTLADLDGADKVGRLHLAETLSYRALADDIKRAA